MDSRIICSKFCKSGGEGAGTAEAKGLWGRRQDRCRSCQKMDRWQKSIKLYS